MLTMLDPQHVSPRGGSQPIRLSIFQKERLLDLFEEQIASGAEENAEARAKAAFRKEHRVSRGAYVLRSSVSYTTPSMDAAAADGVDLDDNKAVQSWIAKTVAGELSGMTPDDSMSDDDLKAARFRRSARYGIDALESGGSMVFMEGQPNDIKAYGDPVNLKFPASTADELKASFAKFSEERASYSQRSQRTVFSRLVAKALQDNVAIDKNDENLDLLAPDMRRRVEDQQVDSATEARSGISKSATKPGAECRPFVKADLRGGSIEDLLGKLGQAVDVASDSGLLGEPSGEGYRRWAYIHAVYDTYLVISSYLAGNYEKDFWHKADWRWDGDEVVLSNFREVKRVESFSEVSSSDSTPADDEVRVSDAFKAVERSVNGLRKVHSYRKDDGSIVREVPIVKMDAPERTVWVEVYVPFERDTYGDWMRTEQIWKAMVYYMAQSQRIDAGHDFVERSVHVVECFQARAGDQDFSEGAWVLALKVDDVELWRSIESGEYRQVSMAGTAREDPSSVPPHEL